MSTFSKSWFNLVVSKLFNQVFQTTNEVILFIINSIAPYLIPNKPTEVMVRYIKVNFYYEDLLCCLWHKIFSLCMFTLTKFKWTAGWLVLFSSIEKTCKYVQHYPSCFNLCIYYSCLLTTFLRLTIYSLKNIIKNFSRSVLRRIFIFYKLKKKV